MRPMQKKCFNCESTEHLRADCPRAPWNRNKNQGQPQVNNANEQGGLLHKKDVPQLLLASQKLDHQDRWLVTLLFNLEVVLLNL